MELNSRELYFDEKEASAILRVAVSTLQTWRSANIGPAYLKFGSRVRYSRTDLDAYTTRARVRTLDMD